MRKKAPKIRKFQEILDYGRKGRVAYVADLVAFAAAPSPWTWREVEFSDPTHLGTVIKYAMARGFAFAPV